MRQVSRFVNALVIPVALVFGVAACTSQQNAPTAGAPSSPSKQESSMSPTPTTTGTSDQAGIPMSVEQFWSLVDDTTSESPEDQAAQLQPRLAALSHEDLAAYQRRFVLLANALATESHYGVAELIMGSVSQDVFVDFRTWVVYQGQGVYDAFLADPDSLADHGPVDDEQVGMAEVLEFLPDEVHAGISESNPDTVYIDPAGPPIDHHYATLATAFPRVATAYLPSPAPVGSPADEGPREIRKR